MHFSVQRRPAVSSMGVLVERVGGGTTGVYKNTFCFGGLMALRRDARKERLFEVLHIIIHEVNNNK